LEPFIAFIQKNKHCRQKKKVKASK